MSVPKELLYILDLVKNREVVEKMLDVPDGYEVLNITDDFLNGGPVVISKIKKGTEEERIKNREKLDYAVTSALEAFVRSGREIKKYPLKKAGI